MPGNSRKRIKTTKKKSARKEQRLKAQENRNQEASIGQETVDNPAKKSQTRGTSKNGESRFQKMSFPEVKNYNPGKRVLELDEIIGLAKPRISSALDELMKPSIQLASKLNAFKTFDVAKINTGITEKAFSWLPDVNVLRIGIDYFSWHGEYLVLYKTPSSPGQDFILMGHPAAGDQIAPNQLTVALVEQAGNSQQSLVKRQVHSNRGSRFWQWGLVDKTAKKREHISLFSYDLTTDSVIRLDMQSGQESSMDPNSEEFAEFTHIIAKQRILQSQEDSCRKAVDLEGYEYVGTGSGICVFFSRESRRLLAMLAKTGTVLWYSDLNENLYHSVDEEKVVSCREEYVYYRDLKTGHKIANGELQGDSYYSYSPPLIVNGEVFVADQEGILWEIQSWKTPAGLRQLGVENELTLRGMPREKFSLPLMRYRPITQDIHCYLYGQKPSRNELAKATKSAGYMKWLEDEIKNPLGKFERELRLMVLTLNYTGRAVWWILNRLNKQAIVSFLTMLPKGTNEVTQSMMMQSFQDALSASLLRSKSYYEYHKARPFLYAYHFEQSNETLPLWLSDDIRGISVEAAFTAIHSALLATFAFINLPDFDELFFGDRQNVRNSIILDFDQMKPVASQEFLSERAHYYLQLIEERGGLANFPTDEEGETSNIFDKLRELNSLDRAYIYEYNLIRYRQVGWRLLGNTGFSMLEEGHATRALAYYFLVGLYHYDCFGSTELDAFYRSPTRWILRAFGQQVLFGDQGFEKAISQLGSETMIKHDGVQYVIQFLFGHSWPSSENTIRLRLAMLRNSIEIGNVESANRLYSQVRLLSDDYILKVENENLQLDFVQRIYAIVPELVRINLDHGNVDQAFAIFDDSKSQVMRLYLTPDNLEILRARIEQDPFYRQLKQMVQQPLPSDSDTERRVASIDQASTSKYSTISYPQLDQLNLKENTSHNLLQALSRDSVILEYFMDEVTSGVFIVMGETKEIRFLRLSELNKVPEVVRKLQELIATSQTAIGATRRIKQLLHQLHGYLIGPILNAYDLPNHLIIIPTHSLFRVPFSALFDGNRYLIEDFDITINPSTTVHAACSQAKFVSQDKIAVLRGDDPSLFGLQTEMEHLESMFPNRVEVFGNSKAMLKNGHQGYLHISAHGQYDDNHPLLSSIVLSQDDSINVIDLYGLNLGGIQVAVVNTCVSGESKIAASDDLLGLVRGFLMSGCPTVVNTLWNLNDAVAPVFTMIFYSNLLKGQIPSRAYAATVREIIASGQYDNPYFWGCYQVYGRI